MPSFNLTRVRDAFCAYLLLCVCMRVLFEDRNRKACIGLFTKCKEAQMIDAHQQMQSDRSHSCVFVLWVWGLISKVLE